MSKVSKKKKGVISKRSISIMCILLVLAILIGCLTAYVQTSSTISSNITVDEIQEKVLEAIGNYDYCLYALDVQDSVADESTTLYRYVLSCEREGSYQTYMYLDSNDLSLYQCWEYNNEDEVYDIYILDNTYNVWVKTTLDSQPVTGTPWNVFTDLSNYELADVTDTWSDTDDECYILEMLGTGDDYDVVYEEIFIRKSDFIPMGILSLATSESETDTESYELDASDIDTDLLIEDVEAEVPAMSKRLQMYEVAWANSSCAMFDIPEEFLSEDEYMEYISTHDAEEEEEPDE